MYVIDAQSLAISLRATFNSVRKIINILKEVFST